MNKRLVELCGAGAFAALFAFLLSEALGYSARSAYMPAAASGIGLLMCLIWAVQAARGIASGPAEYYGTTRTDYRRFAMILAVGVAYVLGFVWVGFFTSTLIMVPVVAVALGYRNWRVVGLTTLGFALILYLVFRLLLSVPLPPEAILRLIGA